MPSLALALVLAVSSAHAQSDVQAEVTLASIDGRAAADVPSLASDAAQRLGRCARAAAAVPYAWRFVSTIAFDEAGAVREIAIDDDGAESVEPAAAQWTGCARRVLRALAIPAGTAATAVLDVTWHGHTPDVWRRRWEMGAESGYPRVHPPRVLVGTPTVAVRGYPAAPLRALFRAHGDELRFAIEEELHRHPDLCGTARIRFTIGPDGHATVIVESRSLPETMHATIASSFRRWTFPVPPAGTTPEGAVSVGFLAG